MSEEEVQVEVRDFPLEQDDKPPSKRVVKARYLVASMGLLLESLTLTKPLHQQPRV